MKIKSLIVTCLITLLLTGCSSNRELLSFEDWQKEFSEYSTGIDPYLGDNYLFEDVTFDTLKDFSEDELSVIKYALDNRGKVTTYTSTLAYLFQSNIDTDIVMGIGRIIASDDDVAKYGYYKYIVILSELDVKDIDDSEFYSILESKVPHVVDSLELPPAMSEEEFNNAKCANCGHDVSDVIDNTGGYWCEVCDYINVE